MEITDILGTTILSNGIHMPYLGLGVYKAKNGEEINSAIKEALNAGYRLIDTAAFYGNEEGVGKAIRESGISREDIFITSKIWIEDQGTNTTRKALETSLKKLGMDYLDLYLIHWPVPDKYLETWKVLQELYEEGKIRAIGVSNCLIHQLEEIRSLGGVQPMVLQNEFHPKLIQQEIIEYCAENQIQYQAWSPLMRGEILDNSLIHKIAEKYRKSEAQIVLRWDLQKGVATIPKSIHRDRIIENANIFDFELTEYEVESIDKLEDNTRTGAHPDHFMEHFS
ncbi:aldo/keto reductase [Christiangramia forsetii]|uniref:Aldo/keto reductase family protein n=2 Tax=Christiangramia forsetii TaxID=411153 RepID=A0LZM0_CHRFK|nr:aldo/keto reductase [Christiangramia forsetii]GGG38618.1 glyoxal reductase [Christiangramia forsetii]CAL65815.1 aldo/keto reductase family protein [Christiangramia forsetii KT0803]